MANVKNKKATIEIMFDDSGEVISYAPDEWWSYEVVRHSDVVLFVIKDKDYNWIAAYNMAKILGFTVTVEK